MKKQLIALVIIGVINLVYSQGSSLENMTDLSTLQSIKMSQLERDDSILQKIIRKDLSKIKKNGRELEVKQPSKESIYQQVEEAQIQESNFRDTSQQLQQASPSEQKICGKRRCANDSECPNDMYCTVDLLCSFKNVSDSNSQLNEHALY
ncbi:UNKNOWN [Stylonychia lemnae]|uniref:Dickkopf N-terminal cysteine-rich domain-containing protein n=1 Tax=Stylonychia lemnae TaxID=5949 RepID=A0A078ACT9_STYLE|nr:UNKNOWN [Stylonychia lemnae]|eukprot:CDW78658.1 UNKNOWN [Stylonychia lemnae]